MQRVLKVRELRSSMGVFECSVADDDDDDDTVPGISANIEVRWNHQRELDCFVGRSGTASSSSRRVDPSHDDDDDMAVRYLFGTPQDNWHCELQ